MIRSGVPRVERRVGAARRRSIPIACASAVVRSASRGADDERSPSGRSARPRRRAAPSRSRARRRARPSLAGTISIAAGSTRGRSRRRARRSTVLRSFANQASAPGPAIATSVAPATGRLSSSAIRQRGSFQRVPSYSSRTGAESAMRACAAAGARSAAVDLDRIEHDRQRDRLAALEPRQRAHDPLGGDVLGEPAAGLARHDLDGEAAPDELRLDVALVDRAREPGELEVERRRRRPAPAARSRSRRSGSAGA